MRSADGSTTLYTSTVDMGQGSDPAFAQIATFDLQYLEVPPG